MTLSAPAVSPAPIPTRSPKKSIARLVIATSVGNALEWYDIAVYGYFAVYIAKAFFPNSDPTISLLLTLGTFALSFLTRPLGGVILGIYADGHGRKASLMISILLMTLGTLVVASMPAYQSIGVAAPIAVLVVRLVQGFSAGAIVVTFVTPFAGIVSDRIGRTTHMITINVLLLISIFPAFLLLTNVPTPAVIIVAVFWIATLKSLYYGPLAALMSELQPAETRATGLGLGYNIGVMIFGGMGPVTMAWLGNFPAIGDLAPGYYLTTIGVLSLVALVVIRRTVADVV